MTSFMNKHERFLFRSEVRRHAPEVPLGLDNLNESEGSNLYLLAKTSLAHFDGIDAVSEWKKF